MPSRRFIRYIVGFGLAAALAAVALGASSRQAGKEQTSPKHRTSPIYATAKDGTPAAGLTAADLTVTIAGQPISDFSLTKGGSQNKLVFLVFDTASLSSNLLAKSKKIAQSVVSPADAGVRFVVMSIDPGAGLKAVCGPTTDKEMVSQSIAKSIASKSNVLFRRSASDMGSYPADGFTESRNDGRQERQVGTIIITSLRTLNAVLGRFPESDKVVQLYSSGIPQVATLDPSAVSRPNLPTDPSNVNWAPSQSRSSDPPAADSTTLDEIGSLGQGMKKNGALLFAVDVAGTRIGENSASSGERSLRMLVNEAGGRFFKGTDADISQSLAAMDQGYYELSVSLPQEIRDAGIPLEVRAKNPDISLSSVSSLAKARSFGEMTAAEKQVIVMTIVSHGLVGDIGLKVSTVPAKISGNGEESQLSVELPAELSQAEWDIYKVWREAGKGTAQIEKEHVVSESPLLTFSMASRENTLQDAVLVQAKSGTVLVIQGKEKTKS